MLHAAAMFTGLFAVWLLLTQQWSSVEDFAVAGAAALACVLLTARLGGFGRGGAFTHAPRLILLALARSGAVFGGALATIRAALGTALRPALVRVKTRASGDFSRAALADMIGAAPGAVVVEADAEGLLVHVLDEESIDAVNLGKLEARVVSALEGKSAA